MGNSIKPVLKWAGGKRQLLGEILPCIPDFTGRYYEPFIGGGALLFELQPSKAIINDYNPEIIILYRVIKERPQELIGLLKIHENMYKTLGAIYYYNIRDLDRNQNDYMNMSEVEKAARTVFLNKTCFNGLYRVNRSGFYNTPIGKYKNPDICPEKVILKLSEYFNQSKIKFLIGDYKVAIKKAKQGDFVYLDPPYYPISETSSFTDYTQGGFNKTDQIRLFKDCERLNAKGVKFLQSNSDCDFIRELYKDFYVKTVGVKRSINSVGTKRNNATEVLIANYNIL